MEHNQDALTSNQGQYALIQKGTISLSNPRSAHTPLRIHLSTRSKMDAVAGGSHVKVDACRPEDWTAAGWRR